MAAGATRLLLKKINNQQQASAPDKRQTIMQASIFISGQINGNRALLNAVTTIDSKSETAGFGNYKVIYPTKGAAKKALWNGYLSLRENEPDFVRKDDYSAKYGTLSYDASSAKISD